MNQQITSMVIRQTIPDATTLTSFTEHITVGFTPDLIRFSNLYYDAKADEGVIYKVTSSIVNSLDSCIGVGNNKVLLSEPMTFTNNKPISGTYQFNIDQGGFNPGNFVMMITFIKN